MQSERERERRGKTWVSENDEERERGREEGEREIVEKIQLSKIFSRFVEKLNVLAFSFPL